MNPDKAKTIEMFKSMKDTINDFKEQFPNSESVKITSLEEQILTEKTYDPETKSIIMNVEETQFDQAAIQKIRNCKSQFVGKVNTNVGTQEINRIKTENSNTLHAKRVGGVKNELPHQLSQSKINNVSTLESERYNYNESRKSQIREPMSRLGTSQMEGLELHQREMQSARNENFDEFLNQDANENQDFSFYHQGDYNVAKEIPDPNLDLGSRQSTTRNHLESPSIYKSNSNNHKVNLRVKSSSQKSLIDQVNSQIINDSKISEIGRTRNIKHIIKNTSKNDHSINTNSQALFVNRKNKVHPLQSKIKQINPSSSNNNNDMIDTVQNKVIKNNVDNNSLVNKDTKIARQNIKSRLNKTSNLNNTIVDAVSEACEKMTENEVSLEQKNQNQLKNQDMNTNFTSTSEVLGNNDFFQFHDREQDDFKPDLLNISNIGEQDITKSQNINLNEVSQMSGVSNLVNANIGGNEVDQNLSIINEVQPVPNEQVVKSNRIKHGIKSSNSLANLSMISGIAVSKKSNRRHGLHQSVIGQNEVKKSTILEKAIGEQNILTEPLNGQSINLKNEMANINIIKKEVEQTSTDPENCSLCTQRLMDANETTNNNNPIVMTECQHQFHSNCWANYKKERKFKRKGNKMMCPNCKKDVDLC